MVKLDGFIRIFGDEICPECGRTFDLLDREEADEFFFGHDCERKEDAK